MAIHDIWLANLKDLVKAEGKGNQRRGLRAVADVAGLSEEYLYQLVEGKLKKNGEPRQVGPDAAEKISKGFREGRDENWFDVRTPSKAQADTGPLLANGLIEQLAMALRTVGADERDGVSRKLAALALAPDSAQLVAALNNALSVRDAAEGPARVKPEHQEELDTLAAKAEARKNNEHKQRRSVPRR